MPNLQPHTLALPDLNLSYLEWGSGGEPLLVLHGMADCGLVWADLATALQDRYHVVAPDLRGHGDSDKPPSGYRWSDIVADLQGLMDHLGWSSAHVLAHSWSAKVAAVWATQQGDRIRSLILVDPFFINAMPPWMTLTFPLLYRVLPFLKMLGPFASRAAAEQQARQLKQYRDWSALQQAVFDRAMEQKPDGTWGSKFAIQARDEIFTDVMEVAGLTQAIALPTLFIQPQQGLNRTDWQMRPYRTYLTNLQIVQVPGHHWCFLSHPQPFNQAVAEFLQTLALT